MNPRPSKITTVDELKNFYWLKTELITFCKKQGLATLGGKLDLTSRIEHFLTTGDKASLKSAKKIACKDSDLPITTNTAVVNYRNDTKTREFFIGQIGNKFKFNVYLRQFIHPENIKLGLTYGDLVEGWVKFEAKNKDSKEKPIEKQFEYNQFIKDYFANEKDKALKEAIEAWKLVKSKPGSNTYTAFKLIRF